MKIKQIIFILILFTIHYSLITAQENNHVFVERGSTKTLTWKAAGDYSAYDSLYFVVKPCTSNTCARLIQKPTGVSYSAPYTTMTCTLYVDETASFNAARYYYSIYAYGPDTVWVTSGNFNLMLNGQTPTDGVASLTPYYTIALSPPVHDPAFIIGDSSADSWSQIDSDSMRVLLGVDTVTSATSLPDSIIYTSELGDTAQVLRGLIGSAGTDSATVSSLINDTTNVLRTEWVSDIGDTAQVLRGLIDAVDVTNYVDKTSLQDIIAQKNFLSGAKFDDDSSMSLNNDLITLGKNAYVQNYLTIHPYYSSSANWTWGTIESLNGAGEPNWTVLSFGSYNSDNSDPTEPSSGLSMEVGYEYSPGLYKTEFYFWTSYPTPGATTIRPLGVNVTSLGGSSVALAADEIFFTNEGFGDFIKITTATNSLQLLDTIVISAAINNYNFLTQMGTGGGTVPLMRIDNSNSVLINPFGSAFTKINSPILAGSDTVGIEFGNYSGDKNYGFTIRTSGSNSGGSMWWNGDSAWFGLNRGGGNLSGHPTDWNAASIDDYRVNFLLGGSILLGTKNKMNLDRGIAFGLTANTPTAVTNQVAFYNSGGDLYAMNGLGFISVLTGTPTFPSLTSTTKITSPLYQGTTVVVNSSSPTDIASGAGFTCYIRDNSAGGTALVIYENSNTPVIISQVGAVFTTASPGANEIQLIGGFVKMTALAGSGMNGHQLGIIVLKPSD